MMKQRRVLLAMCGLLLGGAGCSSTSATATHDGGTPPGDSSLADGQAPPPNEGGSKDTGVKDSPAGGGDAGDGGAPSAARTVSQYVGVNAFIDDPIDKLTPIGIVREYHNWGWIADNYASSPAYPDMLYEFMNFNGWDWDVYFSGLVAGGTSGFPAVQGSVPWMNNSAIPPVNSGADPTLAASYVAHADAMFQIAARYGSTKVPDAKLKLLPTQTRVSGLGTVQYYEDFNEEDNAAAFTPAAMAAMASADYDGDQGRLGATFGVKNADSHALLVMGGLSGAYPSTQWEASIATYLDGMRAWATSNRGGSFPADVINVHYYSFGPSNAGISPEDDGVKDKLASVVSYRDKNLPGKEVWWTEFGYDTFDQSVLHAPAIGGNSEFIVQGQWLVRAMLAGLGAGIDRATLYILRDSCVTTDTACQPQIQFNTSGLTGIKGDWTPKASWYFIATFRTRLLTMSFSAEQTSGNPNVTVYAFKDTKSKGGALVVWAPTSTAQVVSGYRLALPAGVTTASSVALTDGQQNGVETALTPAGGTVTIDVSETPQIILVNAM
jgi:hypothetical protein